VVRGHCAGSCELGATFWGEANSIDDKVLLACDPYKQSYSFSSWMLEEYNGGNFYLKKEWMDLLPVRVVVSKK
jgi:hypothetical protein